MKNNNFATNHGAVKGSTYPFSTLASQFKKTMPHSARMGYTQISSMALHELYQSLKISINTSYLLASFRYLAVLNGPKNTQSTHHFL
jgi:hypothetical protein